MKKISIVMTLLTVMLLLASCSKRQGAKLVPENAVMVIRMDVVKAQDNAGMSGKDSELSKWLKKQVKNNSDMEKEVREKVLDIIDDPTKSGIDVTEPVYFYVAMNGRNDAEVGLVGDMASQGDLTDLINTVGEQGGLEVQEANGAKYVMFDRSTALIYTGKWFFFGQAREDDVEDLVETLKDRASGKGSLDGNEAFEQMCSKEGVAQLLVLGSGLEDVPDIADVKKALPEDLELKDLGMLLDLALNPGEAVLTAETVALSEEARKYVEKNEDILKNIDKSQAEYISDKGFSMFVNLNTKKLWKIVEPMAKTYGITDRDVLDQFEGICNSLDGKAAIDLYAVEDDKPQYNIYIGTDNTQLADLLGSDGYSNDSIAYVEGDETVSYTIPSGYDYDWYSDSYEVTSWNYAGYKNGQTYYTTNEWNLFERPEDSYPTRDIKGKGIYARFNFKFFDALKDSASGDDYVIFDALAGGFDYVELYNEEGGKGVLRLTTKNKKKNPVEVIASIVKDMF